MDEALFQRDLSLRLGLAYQSTGQWDDALQRFEEARQEDPESYLPYFQLGVVYLHRELWESAFQNFVKAIQRGPAAAECYNNLGVTYWMQQSEEGPEECFVKALSRAELPEATANLGIHYLRVGKLDEAVPCFELAVAKHGKAADYSNLAVAFRLRSSHEAALRALEKAIHLDPSFAPAYANLSALYGLKGSQQEARQVYAKYVQFPAGLAIPFQRFLLTPLVVEKALSLEGAG